MTDNYDHEAAAAAGVVTEEDVFVDYFGFEDIQKHFLPDRKQYFVLQRMNEGQKSRYQRDTRQDVKIERSTGDAKLRTDPATERHALIKACVINWFMFRKNPATGKVEEVPFSESGRGLGNLDQWLAVADPKLVEDLEKACRKLNPWMLAELSVDDIDKEIENLKEMREAAVKREQGE